MSLSTIAASLEAFAKKEIKGAEALVSKGVALEQKIAPDLSAIKADAILLYNAAKEAQPVVIEVVNGIATLIADLAAAGI